MEEEGGLVVVGVSVVVAAADDAGVASAKVSVSVGRRVWCNR